MLCSASSMRRSINSNFPVAFNSSITGRQRKQVGQINFVLSIANSMNQLKEECLTVNSLKLDQLSFRQLNRSTLGTKYTYCLLEYRYYVYKNLFFLAIRHKSWIKNKTFHSPMVLSFTIPSKSIGRSPMGVLYNVAVERAHLGV